MALIRYRPFGNVNSLQREMNDLLESFLDSRQETTEGLSTSADGTWLPSVNVSETADNVLLLAELPGVSAEDVDISVLGDILTIKGEKKQEVMDTNEQWHRVERSFGSFTRSFRLPVPIVTDKVAADYKNGVLRVTLPKAEESRKKAIQIKVGE